MARRTTARGRTGAPRDNAVWNQIIYGDGGQSGFSSTNDALRFNTFTGQANDANFRDGDPTKWVIISAPIISSPEGAFFYPPVIADPHRANGGTIFQGSFERVAHAGLGRRPGVARSQLS